MNHARFGPLPPGRTQPGHRVVTALLTRMRAGLPRNAYERATFPGGATPGGIGRPFAQSTEHD